MIETVFDHSHRESWAAFWAAWGTWAAILPSSLIGLATLWMVRTQLKQNTAALEAAAHSAASSAEAARAAFADSRAWIKIIPSNVYLYWLKKNPNGLRAHAKVALKNIGRTPALHCDLSVELVSDYDHVSEAIERAQNKNSRHNLTIFPGDEENLTEYGDVSWTGSAHWKDNKDDFFVVVVASYATHEESEVRRTTKVLRVCPEHIGGDLVVKLEDRIFVHLDCRDVSEEPGLTPGPC